MDVEGWVMSWGLDTPSFGFSGLGSNPSADLSFAFALDLQVREEIYTAFNTIYTVLCEFRKP
jgi:hypothetical protein